MGIAHHGFADLSPPVFARLAAVLRGAVDASSHTLEAGGAFVVLRARIGLWEGKICDGIKDDASPLPSAISISSVNIVGQSALPRRALSLALRSRPVWPILANFGSYELGTYGVLFAVAILVSLWLARHLSARDGLNPAHVNDAGLGALLFGFAGSVGLGIFVSLASGAGVSVADFRNTGVIHGGLLGGMIAALYFAKRFSLSLPLLVDAYVPATALGQAIGRLGCFAAGCCFGSPSDGALSVTYTNVHAARLGGVPLYTHVHPVQLYDAAAHVVLFGLLFMLHKNRRFVGRLFGVWCILEGATRIIMESFRGDLGRGVWFEFSWLSTGRLTAGLIILLGIGYLSLMNRRTTLPAPPSASAT